MKQVPPDKPCPSCGVLIPAYMSYHPMNTPEQEEYDHYWCERCSEAFEFEDMGYENK